MKILIIISTLFTVAIAQVPSLTCNYYYSGNTYGCQLSMNNPNGFDDFTEIGGIHLEGFTNEDVAVLSRMIGVSSIVPSIICDTFTNLVQITLDNIGLTEVGDNAFSGCFRVTTLNLYLNKITTVSPNAFVTLPELTVLFLDNNMISTLSENLFASQQNLMQLHLSNNPFYDFPSGIFRPLQSLRYLYLTNANIGTINNQWFATNANLQMLDMPRNRINLSAENFLGLESLNTLNLRYNAINVLPVGAFKGLSNLQTLYLSFNNLTELQADSFTGVTQLVLLDISNNSIEIIHDGAFRGLDLLTETFVGLTSLRLLNLGYNAINEVSVETFAGLPNLESLHLHGNNFTGLQVDLFRDLSQLTRLDISHNPIDVLHDGVLRGLSNLSSLGMGNCRLRQVRSSYFNDLRNLTYLSLIFNEIEELPEGVFVGMPNLVNIRLMGNRLKTIRRNSFGTLTSVEEVTLNNNIVNAVDRAFIDDAVSLRTLYFSGNLCASDHFGDFLHSRPEHLLGLETCFRNMLYIVDTVTEADDEYSFFEAPQPGIVIRVNASNEVQIALSSFNATSTPIIEIMIGATNNTRSIIRLNQETNEVNASTPNIIIQDQWNDFRVTWANQFLFVYSGNNTLPFMGFTMQNFFTINFYGLRSVETRATWTVRPLE